MTEAEAETAAVTVATSARKVEGHEGEEVGTESSAIAKRAAKQQIKILVLLLVLLLLLLLLLLQLLLPLLPPPSPLALPHVLLVLAQLLERNEDVVDVGNVFGNQKGKHKDEELEEELGIRRGRTFEPKGNIIESLLRLLWTTPTLLDALFVSRETVDAQVGSVECYMSDERSENKGKDNGSNSDKNADNISSIKSIDNLDNKNNSTIKSKSNNSSKRNCCCYKTSVVGSSVMAYS